MDKLIQGDALEELEKLDNESINCCITSPPYWALRDYGVEGQLGLEPTFQEYINKLCDIFDEVKRVLRKDGTCWVVLGDTYGNSNVAGNKVFGNPEFNKNRPSRENTKTPEKKISGYDKCLLQIPSRFSIEMCNRGWILRNSIIWFKPNCMPSSVKDRFTADYEYLFFFVKTKKYWFETQYELATFPNEGKWSQKSKKGYKDNQEFPARKLHEFVTGNNRNKRCVWRITTKPFKGAHFAVFPEELVKTPILAGCPKGGIVIDPFSGSGTVGVVAQKLGRDFIGIELNPEYIEIAEKRLDEGKTLFGSE